MSIITVGIDLAKNVFAVHGVDETGKAVLIKPKVARVHLTALIAQLPPCRIGMEACSGAHHWARLFREYGHTVKLMDPKRVSPYRLTGKRGKNDAADAAAICEAVSRPNMRFVPIKSEEQQAACMLMTVRERLVSVKSQLSNAFRSYAAEFGIVGAAGRQNVHALIRRVLDDESLPELARELFRFQAKEYAAVEARLEEIETRLMKWHRENEASRRIATIPGIGPIGATMLSMKAPPAESFRSGRDFAAWIGLTPRDHSTGGRMRHGGITKAGDAALRSVLVVGATALLRHIRAGRHKPTAWLAALLERKPPKLVAVALANKFARIAWRLMMSGGIYSRPSDSMAA